MFGGRALREALRDIEKIPHTSSVNLCNARRGIAEADAVIDAAVVHILCMLGMDYAEAKIVAGGLHVPLEPEE